MSALGHHRDSIANLAALNSSAKLKGDRSYTTDDVDRLSRVHDEPIVVNGQPGNGVGPHGDDFSNEVPVYEQVIAYPNPEPEMPSSPELDQTPNTAWGQSEYDDDYYDDFDLTLYNENKDMTCCLFPWVRKEEDESDSDEDIDNTSVPISRYSQRRTSFSNKTVDSNPVVAKRQPSLGSINDDSDDEKATSEDEKKVDTPDKDDNHTNSSTPLPHTAKPTKSILKRTNIVIPEPQRTLKQQTDDGNKSRRSLFTNAYDQTSKRHTSSSHRVQFSPMARVTYITSCSQMSLLFKSFIWWQKSDFEDFKKTARIIAKAMLTGGSEIWLQTSNAWHVPRKQQQRRGSVGAISNNHDAPADNDDEGDYDVGHKWWCKFGHSRRGLEHIVSMDEGRQRQENVALAISAVMDEQQRQKMSNRSDPDKLANISSRYTSWARDLALAAGLADADSVRQKFGPNAKPRSYYLEAVASHSAAAWQMVTSSGGRHLSVDVLTKSLTDSELSPTVLDMNTHSGPRRASLVRTESVRKSHGSEENIHGKGGSISKKAAGFGGGVTDGIDRNLLVQRRLVTSTS